MFFTHFLKFSYVSGGYIFNTEAHPIDVSALRCCEVNKQNNEKNNLFKLLRKQKLQDLIKIARPTLSKDDIFLSQEQSSYKHCATENRTRPSTDLGCPGLPYHMRLTKYGQVFVDD